MNDLLPIVSRVTGVFLVMGVGALARKRNWLTRESDASLANLTANVLLPMLFIDRVLAGSKLDSLLDAWIPPAIGFSTSVLGLILALAVARGLGRFIGCESDSAQRAFALGVGICNYGYIPLPLAQFFYPDAEVDLILHNVGVDIALWTVGIWIIAGGKDSGMKRALLSPPILAILFAVTIKQLGLVPLLPDAVLQMTHELANCTIPLGLLLSGAIIVDFIPQARWRDSVRTIVAAVVLRQGIMPIIMLGSAALLPLAHSVEQVVVLQAAMPSATFPIVLARLYDKDTTTALRVILGTGLVGLITIPLWLYAGRLWLLGI